MITITPHEVRSSIDVRRFVHESPAKVLLSNPGILETRARFPLYERIETIIWEPAIVPIVSRFFETIGAIETIRTTRDITVEISIHCRIAALRWEWLGAWGQYHQHWSILLLLAQDRGSEQFINFTSPPGSRGFYLPGLTPADRDINYSNVSPFQWSTDKHLDMRALSVHGSN